MTRFTPDTWLDALMRPLAMTFPNGWVYIEIIAPDVRFALILLLLVVVGAIAATGRARISRSLAALLVFSVFGFIAWLATTGNGRYFIVVLLLAGVISVALVHSLPLSRSFRLSVTVIIFMLQGFALSVNQPWRPWAAWDFAQWGRAPYFHLELDEEAATMPATYVTLSVISYSLVAPQFPPESRWMNLSSQLGADPNTADSKRVQQFLSASTLPLQLLGPSIPDQATADGAPQPAVVGGIDALLSHHRLKLRGSQFCRYLHSETLTAMSAEPSDSVKKPPKRVGMWACQLIRTEKPASLPAVASTDVKTVFEQVEQQCPRFFPPGQTGSTPIPDGVMRHYQSADMKLYVFKDGAVYYKYHRALNPVFVGRDQDVRTGKAKVQCDAIRGRAGLPWEREI